MGRHHEAQSRQAENAGAGAERAGGVSEQTPNIQDVIDRFAGRDVAELETLKGQVNNLLNKSEREINAVYDEIAQHRKEIELLEGKAKALLDEAWPYSLMKLAIEEAVEQKAAAS